MAVSEIIAKVDEPLYNEISRVWEQFRIANLNVRYYGILAQRKRSWNSGFQIAIAVLSLGALVILADQELRIQFPLVAAALSGLATIISGALPFLGWDEAARRYSFLNRAYQIAESQLRDTLIQMRRSETLTPLLLGKSEVLLDSMSRLQGLDEEEYSEGTLTKKDELSKEVNRSFPPDYVWNNL